jgi:PAS domain S-box-containing protein
VNTDIEHFLAGEREYRAMVNRLPGFVLISGAHGDIEFVNQPALTYFGVGLQDLRRWPTQQTVYADDFARITRQWTDGRAAGEPFESECRFRRHDGEYRWFHFRAVPDRDSDDTVVRWLVLITDVEERKRDDDVRRLNEAFLLEVQRLSRTGGFRMDLVNNRLEFTPELQDAFRVRPEDITNENPSRRAGTRLADVSALRAGAEELSRKLSHCPG